MESLEILGDCFLKVGVSESLYQRYPFDDIGDLTKKGNEQISNSNLSRIAMEKGLQHYLNTTKVIFCGGNANWIPPGYTINEENSKRYLEQKVKSKLLADMIEALIGAVLVYSADSAAIEFMKWLGLDVISIDEHSKYQI
jgi:endoribonuclease Dicer